MIVKKLKVGTLTIMDGDTENVVMQLDELSDISVSPNFSADSEQTFSIDAWACDTCLGEVALARFGDLARTTNSFNNNIVEIEVDGLKPVEVQAKTHKKSRINKKWLKRYGTKTVYQKACFALSECTAKIDGYGLEISSDHCVLLE